MQPASLADQLAEAKEQLSSALQQLGKNSVVVLSAIFNTAAAVCHCLLIKLSLFNRHPDTGSLKGGCVILHKFAVYVAVSMHIIMTLENLRSTD